MRRSELFNNMIEVLGYFADQCDMFKPMLYGVNQLKEEAEIQSVVIDDLTITIMDITMGLLELEPAKASKLAASMGRSAAMASRLQRMYLDGRIDDTYLDQAVAIGWLTPEECAEIKASKAPVVEM